jgi:hypothetical protein
MLLALRILRALLGVFGLIMLKASLQPGYEYFIEGEATSFVTMAWRLFAGVVAIAFFFRLRSHINKAYVTAGAEIAPLRALWSL